MAARSTRLVAAAFLVTLAGAAVTADAQPAAVRVTSNQAEIRTTANPRAAVLTKVAEGTVLEVLAREHDWYRVTIPLNLRPRSTSPASGYIDVHQVAPDVDPAAAGAKPGRAPAPAGQRTGAAARKPGGPGLRVRAFGAIAYERFQAANSFEALYGSPSAPLFGGGVDVALGRRFFVQAEVSHVQRTGERAFLFNGEVFKLGIAQEMRLTPVTVTVGYRRPGRGRLTPYGGGGVLFAFYKEESELAAGENLSKSAVGAVAMAGAEVRVARLVSTAIEGGYRYIPGILGDGGISKEYNESNLGGLTVGFKVLIGR